MLKRLSTTPMDPEDKCNSYRFSRSSRSDFLLERRFWTERETHSPETDDIWLLRYSPLFLNISKKIFAKRIEFYLNLSSENVKWIEKNVFREKTKLTKLVSIKIESKSITWPFSSQLHSYSQLVLNLNSKIFSFEMKAKMNWLVLTGRATTSGYWIDDRSIWQTNKQTNRKKTMKI